MKVSSVSPLQHDNVEQVSKLGIENGGQLKWNGEILSCFTLIVFIPAVTSHHTPTSTFGHLYCLNTLGYGSNLINLSGKQLME